jgi:asparagine synthase (glutamine-hydrolysing)
VEQASVELENILRRVVGQESIADVPLGAFLSGGYDSSLLVALMQTQSNLPVRTFSIGFHESAYDEALNARAVAKHLGTSHTELYITEQDALAVIPKLTEIYDEPLSDSSQIPTYLVSNLTRRHVTVSLSGDGGDELFCGYPRYRWVDRIRRLQSSIPARLCRGISALLARIPEVGFDQVCTLLSKTILPDLRFRHYGRKAHRLAQVLSVGSRADLYALLLSRWDQPKSVMSSSPRDLRSALVRYLAQVSCPTYIDELMLWDLMYYLPDDLMAKLDRASMAVSLETRAPFLHHEVVEFALRLPLKFKLQHGQAKYVLRKILYKYVPAALVDRPKTGFGVPIGQWLRKGLREWAEELLSERALRQSEIFDWPTVRRLWNAHLRGEKDCGFELWDIVCFQAWRTHWY